MSTDNKQQRSDCEGGEMTKGNKRVTFAIDDASDKPADDPRYYKRCSPGKKGGSFSLPFGVRISVPEGTVNKKDSITCEVTTPSQRGRHCPSLSNDEHITSELFILKSTARPLKKPVILQLPYYPIDHDHLELNVKGKWEDEEEWMDVGFLQKGDANAPYVELETDRLGMFAMTSIPLREIFEVTPQGCLYNARLSRYISVRFPKKAIDSTMQCAMQIIPISTEKLSLAKERHPMECSDIEAITEFIHVIPSKPCHFRRSVTLKLPLPSDVESDEDDVVAVFHKTDEKWDAVEANYKFTKTTVSFDVKNLSKYCVVVAKPERQRRIREGLSRLEEISRKDKGDILAFTLLEEKCWSVILKCCASRRSTANIELHQKEGYSPLAKQRPIIEPESEVRNFRRVPPKMVKTIQEAGGFEISDCQKWNIKISGDIKLCNDRDLSESNELQYFENLPESCRRFNVEPVSIEEKSIKGVINLIPIGLTDENEIRRCTICYHIEVDEEKVKVFVKQEVEPEPEVAPEPEVLFIPEPLPVKSITDDIPLSQKIKPIPQSFLDRLNRSSRPRRIVEREAKVITGRSLRTLSRVMHEGLTLAVHLDLPDSTITGLGFDAIANGLGMGDVTYKILLYWKRMLKEKRDGAVQDLTLALRDMGRTDIATIILQRHSENKELTPECFMAA